MENGLYYAPQDDNYWNFYDWEDGLDGTKDGVFYNHKERKINCMHNLLLCYAMKKIIETGKFLQQKTSGLKADYDKLKFASVDNAISFLKAEGKTPADSINIKALQTEWRRHPDEEALKDFRSKWDTYHKYFAHSLLPEYPRFIDAQHL